MPEFLNTLTITELNFNVQIIERSMRIFIISIPVLVVIAWSALYLQANLFRLVVQVRNYLVVFVWLFIVGILSLLIQFEGELFHFIWLILPAGLAFAFFLLNSDEKQFQKSCIYS